MSFMASSSQQIRNGSVPPLDLLPRRRHSMSLKEEAHSYESHVPASFIRLWNWLRGEYSDWGEESSHEFLQQTS